MLADSIKNAVAKFPPEVGQDDEDSLAKVSRIMKIAQDIQCQVEDLQARQLPSTPLEVLAERKATVSEAATKLKAKKPSTQRSQTMLRPFGKHYLRMAQLKK